MNVSQSIAALSAALVHPAATGTAKEYTRHQTFLCRTLAVAFATLAGAPFFLAFYGAPSLSQTALFGFCLAPLAALTLVAKTGRLDQGHLLCVAALLGLAVTATATSETSLGSASAWLIVAQTESLLSLDRRLIGATMAASGIAFLVLLLGSLTGWFNSPLATLGNDLAVASALAYAALNLLCLDRLRNEAKPDTEGDLARAKAIIEANGDLVLGHDTTGSVNFIGPGSDRLLGLSGDDLFGRGLFEHVHVADRPMFLKAIADAAHEGGVIVTTFRVRAYLGEKRRDGGNDPTFRWIEMRSCGVGAAGAVSLLRDVSDVRRLSADLETALQSVETAKRSKDHFLANMSHELRTPLNAIIGFSEMLGDQKLRPKEAAKQGEYARIIHQSGQHLLAVVNSILDMSKIQSGTFSIVPEPFLVAPLIESCCEIMSLKAQEGGVELVRSGLELLEPVVGDRRACKQILLNLISNAVKFTPANGCVTVSARPEGTALLLTVADTGIGIGVEDLARIGDPFFQAKSSLDRPYEGTGLGLSVVRGLVGLHGGSLSIESEPERGTRATVRLPLDCRFVSPRGSATIETIARRPRHDSYLQDRVGSLPHADKVKKIA